MLLVRFLWNSKNLFFSLFFQVGQICPNGIELWDVFVPKNALVLGCNILGHICPDGIERVILGFAKVLTCLVFLGFELIENELMQITDKTL